MAKIINKDGTVTESAIDPRTNKPFKDTTTELDLTNYVAPVGGPGVVSSSVAGQNSYNTEQKNLTSATVVPPTQPGQPKSIKSQVQNPDGTVLVTYSDGTTASRGIPTAGKDPDIATLDKDKAAAVLKAQQDEKENLKRNENLLSMANKYADDQIASSTATITETYRQLSEAKNKLLQKNIDRVKAYGLAQGGRTVSLQFNDAIDSRESDRLTELANLDRQRDNAIATAKTAAQSGKISALRDANAAIISIQASVRQQLAQIEKDAVDKLAQFKKAEVEQNTARKDAIATAARAAASLLVDDYASAKTDEERQAIIEKYMQENAYGTKDNAVDAFAAISEAVGKAAADRRKNSLADQKTVAEIRKLNKSGTGTGTGTVKYTPTEIKKLRAEGIDPTNIAQADAFLYKKIKPGTQHLDTSLLNFDFADQSKVEQINQALDAGHQIDDILSYLKYDKDMAEKIKNAIVTDEQ